ncbi:MAG: type III pantothenate kinase [Alphaproteobacteria bacterium]
MLLAVDIGNTNTVFAVCKGRNVLHSWRCRTIPARTPDEYAAFLFDLLALTDIKPKKLGAVIVSSVVPDVDFPFTRFVKKYLEREPVFVTRDIVNIVVNIDNPVEVGADRLVNALAVKTRYRNPSIVIDFGTATTFDVMDASGAYIGGVIAPGVNLSSQALYMAASKLPKINIVKPTSVIGKGTVTAMQSGVFWGYAAMIEGLIARITAEMHAKPFIIATGGLAPLFSESLPMIKAVDDNLTLKGLIQVHADNAKLFP